MQETYQAGSGKRQSL